MDTKIKKRLRLHPLLVLPALVLSALFITMVTVYIQPGAFRFSIQGILETPSLIILNLLPSLVLLTLGYCICGNLFASAGGTGLILELLSYANLLKIEGRNDPLIPSDVFLLRESLQAVGDYQLQLHPGLLLLMAGSFLFFVLLAIFVKTPRPKWFWRAGLGLAAVGIFLTAMVTIYPDKDYYNNLPRVDKSNVPLVFNSYGFPYCFLHNFNLYPIDKPEGYDQSTVDSWEEELLPEEEPLCVNILFVMGEAFTDLPDEDCFTYAEGESPIAAYHQIAESEKSLSGHMVASNVSAGTANTEFDVLTGMQTNLISENTTSAFRAVHRNVDSLARVYEDAGYHSFFMHPGNSWFYNRCNVYQYFGITDQTFNDVFTENDRNGSYISDEAFLRVLESLWDEKAQEGSTFAYSVTIENHQSYTYGKYLDPVTETVPLNFSVEDTVLEQLQVYFQGLRHTSEMLLQLTEYLDSQDTPTLLVFFGDHRPNLGTDFLSYRAIGSQVGESDTPEQVIYTYEVPYVIWANDALYENWNMASAIDALELAPDNKISSNYLGSIVYELTGMVGKSAYWDFLTEARRILPVISHGCYYLPDGSYTTELNETQQTIYQKLHWWQYDRLKNGLN